MELNVRERLAIAISRELRDREVVLTGAASAIPLAACLLAQAQGAPNLTILGAGVYINPRRLVPEFTAGWDCQPTATGDMADVFAITELGIDVMFYGGMQIDRHGCVNVHYVTTSRGRLRGPGMANTTLGHTARRTLLFTERHDQRTLVEQVEFASVIGHGYRGRSRRDLDLPNDGPAALFTPQLVMRPDADGVLQPAQVIGDASWGDVIGGLGWRVQDVEPERFVATSAEVRLLREIDSEALLNPARLDLRSNA
jgi:glutaconate CoA-transferase subunit B